LGYRQRNEHDKPRTVKPQHSQGPIPVKRACKGECATIRDIVVRYEQVGDASAQLDALSELCRSRVAYLVGAQV